MVLRIIKMPKGVRIRPTKDRIREALFSMIEGVVQDAAVLDVFAGSGAFGIEALSRGAKRAVFIDNNMRCVETIRQNLKALAVDEKKVSTVKMDVFKHITYIHHISLKIILFHCMN